ncbi:MAG: transmembrane 220 family protein [Pseudomonadota bacterium]
MGRFLQIICFASGLALVAMAGVQWNDPDRGVWMAFYLIAAMFSLWTGWRPRGAIGALAGVYALAALGTALLVFTDDLTSDWIDREGGREAAGLIVTSILLLPAVVRGLRARRARI